MMRSGDDIFKSPVVGESGRAASRRLSAITTAPSDTSFFEYFATRGAISRATAEIFSSPRLKPSSRSGEDLIID